MVAITSVDLINDLLTTLELFVKGEGIPAAMIHDFIITQHQSEGGIQLVHIKVALFICTNGNFWLSFLCYNLLSTSLRSI